MTIIESVRQYIGQFPMLANGILHVDFLPADELGYSVDVIPTDPIVKTYMDGSSKRQMNFLLASRQQYSLEIQNQINNLAFFDAFQAWLEARNNAHNLPNLGAGLKATRFSVTTNGYVSQMAADSAGYQIQLKLEYIKEG